MMSFSNGYVVSLLVDNKPIREFSEDGRRTCRIPFGTEYKLRLINKNLKRAMVSVTIDGTEVLMHGQKIILGIGESMDLERFVENLNEGRRFKFVEASNPGVQDPTSKENGKIEVHFWEEIVPQLNFMRGFSVQNDVFLNQPLEYYSVNCNSSDLGATVEGSQSTQQFAQAQGFETNPIPTTITLWLRGPSVSKPSWEVKFVSSERYRVEYQGNQVHVSSVCVKNGELVLLTRDFALASKVPHLVNESGFEIRTRDFRLG